MITPGDELPLHQTAEPIAFSGTDRNFYDRSWFGGFTDDASLVFELSFGVYPHLNITDAHLSVLRDGVQECVHASAHLGMDRLAMRVGPIRIEVVEHLRVLRLHVDPAETGIGATVEFAAVAPPHQEPRFTWRRGPRTAMDYTRFCQSGRWSGTITIDGETLDVGGARAARDRSWGVRPIGAHDRQPHVPALDPQLFWLWSTTQLDDRSVFFHDQAEADGTPVNRRMVVVRHDPGGGAVELPRAREEVTFAPGTRWPSGMTVVGHDEHDARHELTFVPRHRFAMAGLGYGHREWGFGRDQGPLRVARERILPAEQAPDAVQSLHQHTLCDVTYRHDDGVHRGTGILETLVIGASHAHGFVDVSGPAQAPVAAPA
jgi:hypothetical protein